MNKTKEFSINIAGRRYVKREEAGEKLRALYLKIPKGKELHMGTYQGFNLYLKKSMFYESYHIIVQGCLKYSIDLGESDYGNMSRIENIVRGFEKKIELFENEIEKHKRDMENARKEYRKSWPYEKEYKEKLARQHELNQELDLDKKDDDIENEDEEELEEDLDLDIAR